jgi:hypothetical protein
MIEARNIRVVFLANWLKIRAKFTEAERAAMNNAIAGGVIDTRKLTPELLEKLDGLLGEDGAQTARRRRGRR